MIKSLAVTLALTLSIGAWASGGFFGGGGGGGGDVTSAANIPDNDVVRGDGGLKGIQGSDITLQDGGHLVPKANGTQDFGQATGPELAWRDGIFSSTVKVGVSTLFADGAFDFPGSVIVGDGSEHFVFLWGGGLGIKDTTGPSVRDFILLGKLSAINVPPEGDPKDWYITRFDTVDTFATQLVRFGTKTGDEGGDIEAGFRQHPENAASNGGRYLNAEQVEYKKQTTIKAPRFTTHVSMAAKSIDGHFYKKDFAGAEHRVFDASQGLPLFIAEFDALGNLQASASVDSTEIDFAANGATENHQSAIDARLEITQNLADLGSVGAALTNLGLSAADSVTFGAITTTGVVASMVLQTDALGNYVASSTTNTELAFLNNVTSDIQGQFNDRLQISQNLADLASVSTALTNLGLSSADAVTFGSVTATGATPLRVLIADGLGDYITSSTTSLELSFLNSVTSDIQSQLNTISGLTTGTVGAHSDVDLTGIVATNRIEWDGSKFIAVASTPDLHATSHLQGNPDEIDGDGVEFSQAVTNFTPTGAANTIGNYIEGIDDQFGLLFDSAAEAEVSTTDATPLVISTGGFPLILAEGFAVTYTLECTGVRTDGTAGSKAAGFKFMANFRRPAAGSVTAVGTATTLHSKADSPQQYVANIDLTSNTISASVTGAAAQDVSWKCKRTANLVD